MSVCVVDIPKTCILNYSCFWSPTKKRLFTSSCRRCGCCCIIIIKNPFWENLFWPSLPACQHHWLQQQPEIWHFCQVETFLHQKNVQGVEPQPVDQSCPGRAGSSPSQVDRTRTSGRWRSRSQWSYQGRKTASKKRPRVDRVGELLQPFGPRGHGKLSE